MVQLIIGLQLCVIPKNSKIINYGGQDGIIQNHLILSQVLVDGNYQLLNKLKMM